MYQLLFSLLLVFLPVQLGYHVWPEWALVLGRRLDYLSPTLYFTDILIFFLFVSWCVEKKIHSISFKKISRSAGMVGICFLLFIFVNIFFAANRMVAVFAWIKILELAALGVYIVHEKPKFSQIIFPLSIGVLYSSGIAVIQFFLQHSVGGIFWFLGERTFSAATPGIAQVPLCFPNRLNCPLLLRAYATFPHPNVLGGFLAVTIPLILFRIINFPMNRVSSRKKIFYITTIVLGTVALLLTFSRSAWVVAALSGVYIIFKKKRQLFFPVLIVAALIIFFVGTTFGFQDESVVVREQLNAAALSMVRASPVIGNGMGNFLVQLPDHLVSRQIYFLQPVHNIYLLLLSETGVLGGAVFLWVLWKAVRNMLQKFSIVHFSLLMLLSIGLVDHYLLTLQQGQLMFTIFLSLSLIQ
jgi:hypothetical protein